MNNGSNTLLEIEMRHLVFAAFATAVFACNANAAIMLELGASSASSNSPATGVSASVKMTFTDDADPSNNKWNLSLEIRNTTGEVTPFGLEATTSKLTAFGFELAPDVSYVASSFVGGSYLDTLVQNANLQPGTRLIDLWASDDNNLEGGSANYALPQATTDTVSLQLHYVGTLAALETAMVTTLSSSFVKYDAAFAARFMQVLGGDNDPEGGSDKLYGGKVNGKTVIQEIVPEPISIASWIGLMGVGGLVARRRNRK
jgi:hypothetical protein